MKYPTNEEIARDYRLWQEYADPIGVDTEEWFNTMTIEQKMAILPYCFGEDEEKEVQLNADDKGNQFDYRCPKCGHDDELCIQVSKWANLLPDGCDDEGDTCWEWDSLAVCNHCDWAGIASDLNEPSETL
jgi:hypothetical protein